MTAADSSARTPVLSVRGLQKSFGRHHVLKSVDFEVLPGQLHALLGPNGAGKSTIVRILSGVEEADAGIVEIDGNALGREDRKISIIHQDLGLVDTLSVRENLFMTHPRTSRFGFVRTASERSEASDLLEDIGLRIHPDTRLGDLGLGEKSLVAVARLLSSDARILVLDEVTAALTRKEADFVLERVRRIADAGVGVILVTHRLHEVVAHCEWATVIRDGAITYSGATPSLGDIQRFFVPDWVNSERQRPSLPADGAPLVASLTACKSADVGPVDVSVYSGEVVALVGTLSSKLYAIGHLLAGMATVTSGSRCVRSSSGTDDGRVAFVPEDRRYLGVLNLLDVEANISVSSLRYVSRLGWIRSSLERAAVDDEIERLDVRPAEPTAAIESLSGGNQQKTLMARAALRQPDLYVLCEPTRGVDLATRRAIYEFIENVRSAGAAVLIMTIDPEDALAVADRIGVVEAGEIVSMSQASGMTILDVLEAVS